MIIKKTQEELNMSDDQLITHRYFNFNLDEINKKIEELERIKNVSMRNFRYTEETITYSNYIKLLRNYVYNRRLELERAEKLDIF